MRSAATAQVADQPVGISPIYAKLHDESASNDSGPRDDGLFLPDLEIFSR